MSEFKGVNFKKVTVSNGEAMPARVALNLAPEEVHKLIDRLTALADSPRGAKLTINSQVKEGKFGAFISSYTFVDEIQAPGTGYGGGQGGGSGYKPKGTFKPKQRGMSDATRSAAARTLRSEPIE